MDVGFIGLGAMGSAMAKNIAASGHQVCAWNRSDHDPIDGVRRAASVAEAFDADVVLTMLPDDGAIQEVILDADVIGRLKPEGVHAVCSTISVTFAETLTRVHADRGVGYISTPVLGRPDVAAKGELNVLAAGAPAALLRAQPILEAISKRIWRLGDQPKKANAAKIAANMMITMAIEAMAEAVVLTESNGVGRDDFFDVMLNTLFGGRAYETYSANIARSAYEPGFKAKLGLKDLRLATAAAQSAGRSLPMLAAVKDRMAQAVSAGHGDKDWSIMADFTIKGDG